MRSDWPLGHNENCIEPPCEIFLQLFIENAEIGDENIDINDLDFPLENNGEEHNENDSDDPLENYGPIPIDDDSFSDDSDDLLSCPSFISDTSILGSAEESSSDEREAESEPHCEEPNNDAQSIQNSLNSMSKYSEESWCIDNVSDDESEQREEESDVFLENEYSEMEKVVDPHPRLGNRHSHAVLTADLHSVAHSSEEGCHSNVAYQEFDNCGVISSNDVPLSSGMSHLEESSVELEPSSNNNSLQPSTHISLYVVVPPTNFSNETGCDLLPGVSSDRLFSGLIPINPPCSPASLISDNENFQSDSVPIQNSVKSPDSFDEVTTSDTSAEDNQKSHSISELDPVLGDSISDSKSEIPIGCNDNLQSEFSVYDTNITEENTMILESANSEIISNKTVPSLKRKVTSVDDTVVNKVPKYSSSQSSNDSVNQGSLDNHCRVLSNNSEKQTPCEEDKIDIAASAVSGDNVILTLNKAVEKTSVINEKPKRL